MAKQGNPNWKKGGPSPNPNGRPAVVEAFRDRCRKAVDEHCITAWVEEVTPREVEGETVRGKEWMRASELLASYGYGKPATVLEGQDGEKLEIVIRKVSE